MLPHTHTHILSRTDDPFSTDSKNRSHFITCVSVGMLGGSSAEHCALPIATHEESRLGLFTDLASAVLATAAEEDAGGGLERGRSRVGDVGGCRSGFCVVIDTSQYLMEIDLFRCCGL